MNSGRLHCADAPVEFGAFLRRNGGPLARLEAQLPDRRLALSANTRAAIRQAVDRLDLSPGEEVLVPAWNCGSEVDPLLDAGLSVRLYPVAADGSVDPAEVKARIGPRTRAVYLTHFCGWPQPASEALAELCRAEGLPLIEDAALALLTEKPGAPIGSFGDAAVFCFHKFFTLAGGGALALRRNRPAPSFPRPFPWRPEARLLVREAARGLVGPGRFAARAARRRAAETPSHARGFPEMPTSYRFDAVFRDAGPPRLTRRLLAGLDAERAAEVRRRNHARLNSRVGELEGARPVFPDLPEGVAPVVFPLRLRGVDRDAACAALQAEGIGASPWWGGYHPDLDWSGSDLAAARALKDEVLALPLHQGLDAARIDWMAERLAAHLRGA